MSEADVTLVVRRAIKAPVARVFSAWTEPQHLLRWWGPAEVTCDLAEVDLRVGGRYRLGNRFADGKQVIIDGEFLEVSPPDRLVYTWRLSAGADVESTRVTVRFEPHPGGTEVVIVHQRIANAAVREGHARGWEGCLDGLAALVEA